MAANSRSAGIQLGGSLLTRDIQEQEAVGFGIIGGERGEMPAALLAQRRPQDVHHDHGILPCHRRSGR